LIRVAMRQAPLPTLFVLVFGLSPLALAEPPSAATVVWPGGVVGPAVCVERADWFASVVPAEVPLDQVTEALLRRSGTDAQGTVLHLDLEERLCLLQSASAFEGAAPVPLSAKSSLRPGQRAGCLSGSSSCRTTVAGKEWAYRGERFHLPLLRLRLSESGPDCRAGTALVDDEGSLVGLLTGQGAGEGGDVFAIPASRVRKVVEDFKRHQRSGPVRVGLVFHDESSAPEVVEVTPDSPAAQAGFESGDVVLSLNGEGIDSLAELVELIHTLSAGEEAKFRVLRGIDKITVAVTPRFAEIAASPR
jgi:hypothetical protein